VTGAAQHLALPRETRSPRPERTCRRVDGRDYWEGTVSHQVGTRHLRELPVKCSQALPELGRERLVRVAAVQLAVQLTGYMGYTGYRSSLAVSAAHSAAQRFRAALERPPRGLALLGVVTVGTTVHAPA
jgi:hypothetical protein